MLLGLAIGLVLLDLLTTLIGVRLAGADIEANGLHRTVITRAGPIGFSAFYLAGAAGLIAVAYRLGALIGLVAVLAIVVLNNTVALVRLGAARRR